MAFKRHLSPTFSTEVVVNVPNTKGGFDKNTFTATFKRPMPVMDEGGKPTEDNTLDVYRQENPSITDKQFVRDWMVGWKLVDDTTKEEVPFSPLELEVVLAIEPTPAALVTAFHRAWRGVSTKN